MRDLNNMAGGGMLALVFWGHFAEAGVVFIALAVVNLAALQFRD